jgi:glutamate racemase
MVGSTASPIVVLDSGLGGLTVVRALRRAMPFEDILYFGDTARVPYGSKSAATVTGFVRQIINYLLPHEPKHVVIACNTATAHSLTTVRADFPFLSISGVIDPGANAAIEAAGSRLRPTIGIIGTEGTIRSRAYEKAIHKQRPLARLICQAAPLLVPIIEEGRWEDLRPLLAENLDVLVLGCTHYPVYEGLIARMAGPQVAVIDSADKCAEDVRRRLRAAQLERGERAESAYLRCFVTDNSPRFGALASRFLGLQIEPPTLVCSDELHEQVVAAANAGELRTAV